jgi:hypothetical protein
MGSLDFSQYRHPGVYVDAGTNPTLTTAGVSPSVVCLIGTGVGYHTNTETVSFAAGNSVVLAQKGINIASIVVKGYITDPNASGQSIPHTFVKDVSGTPHDYSTTVDSTGGVAASVTTLVRTVAGAIETGFPQVTVSYQYTDASYHALQHFNDYSSIADTYGPSLDANTGALISPLTFAAQVAIVNGANQIYTLALDPSIGTVSAQFADAYQTLSAGDTSINVVVPLFDGVTDGTQLAGMLATLNAALIADTLKGVLRVALVGLDQGYVGTPAQVAALATGISSTRIVLSYPNQLSYYNGVLNSTITVDGFYLAAGIGGLLASQNPQIPLTHKVVIGFTGLPATIARLLTPTNKDVMATGGVCVVELDRGGRMRIRHGLTTNYAGGILNRELSLVRAQDALYNLLQDTMENSGLIGIPIGLETALQVKATVAGALETAKSTTVGLIVDYNSLAVRQESPPSGDPTVIQVRFAYKPAWPLNYILVNFTVDTSNATTTAVSDLTTTTA